MAGIETKLIGLCPATRWVCSSIPGSVSIPTFSYVLPRSMPNGRAGLQLCLPLGGLTPGPHCSFLERISPSCMGSNTLRMVRFAAVFVRLVIRLLNFASLAGLDIP